MYTKITSVVFFLCSFLYPPIKGSCQQKLAPAEITSLFRHKADSLQRLNIAQKSDTRYAALLIELSGVFSNFNSDSARIYAEKAMAVASKINAPLLISKSYQAIAFTYYLENNFQLQEEYYEKGLRFSIDNKLYAEELRVFRRAINNLCFYCGDYFRAARNSTEGLAVAEEIKDTANIAHYRNVLGYINMKLENYATARDYYTTYYTLSVALKDSLLTAHALLNIADLNLAEKKYAAVNDKLEEAKKIYLILSKKTDHGFTLDERLAAIYHRQAQLCMAAGNYTAALESVIKSVKVTETVGCNPYDVAEYYITYGAVLNAMNNPLPAIEKLKNGLHIARQIAHKENEQNACYHLSEAYKKLNKPDSAYQYLKAYYAIKDSVFNGRMQMKINDITRNKEIQLLNQDKKIQQSAIARQKLMKNLISALAVFLFAIVFLIYSRYRIKQKVFFEQKLNQQQNESFNALVSLQDKERKRIAQDLHDGLGALLSAAKLKLTEINPQNFEGDETKKYNNALQLVDEAAKELRNISHNIMPSSLEKFGLEATLKNLFSSVSFSGLAIHFNMYGFEGRLAEQTEISLYHIILELVNNVVKHANAKNLWVQLIKYPQLINLTVEDDGIGFDKSAANSAGKGIGLSSLQSRIDLLKGTIARETAPDAGTTIIIEIPYA